MSKSRESSSSRPISVQALLENVNEFITSIYNDVDLLSPPTAVARSRIRNITPQPSPMLTSNSSSLNSSSIESELNLNIQADTSSRRLPVSPQNRHNLDFEIDRINRMCDSVDQDLRTIGVFVTGRRGDEHAPSTGTDSVARPSAARRNNELEAIVDLSETQTETPEVSTPLAGRGQSNPLNDGDDDEVVVVSSNIPPVIDLCTPGHEETPRRSTVQRNQLSRRVLDEAGQLEEVPVRRRRVSSATSRLHINNKDVAPASNCNPSGDANAMGTTSDRDPTICPVCMDSFLRRRPTSTKCGHLYCEECIKQAIRLTHKCPLCNTKISDKHLLRIYL